MFNLVSCHINAGMPAEAILAAGKKLTATFPDRCRSWIALVQALRAGQGSVEEMRQAVEQGKQCAIITAADRTTIADLERNLSLVSTDHARHQTHLRVQGFFRKEGNGGCSHDELLAMLDSIVTPDATTYVMRGNILYESGRQLALEGAFDRSSARFQESLDAYSAQVPSGQDKSNYDKKAALNKALALGALGRFENATTVCTYTHTLVHTHFYTHTHTHTHTHIHTGGVGVHGSATDLRRVH
jgi:hypothetical protein